MSNLNRVGRMSLNTAAARYKKTRDKELLSKIRENLSLFRSSWAKQFERLCDGDGGRRYDSVLVSCLRRFQPYSRMNRGEPSAFNRYFVANLLNDVKALVNRRNAGRNHEKA